MQSRCFELFWSFDFEVELDFELDVHAQFGHRNAAGA
jgi:hypothetical protein